MSFFDSLFGTGNPSEKAMGYLGQIPGATSQYLKPYSDAGQQMLGPLSEQYQQLLANPGGKYNEIGGEFQQSPGFQFALKNALQAGRQDAAAGGMLGTPASQYNQMQNATGLANQDYYNYMNGATGLYNQGLQGGQNFANMGLQAGGSLADMIAQTLASQAGYSYAGQAAQNQNRGSMWNNLFSSLGAGGAMAKGGAFGAGGAFSQLM